MTVLEDLLDDLRHLEEFFVPPAVTVSMKLTREQVTALVNSLEALFAIKRAIAPIEASDSN
jgi:hypothetical protein